MAYVSMEEKFRTLAQDNSTLLGELLEYKSKVAEHQNSKNEADKRWEWLIHESDFHEPT